MRYFIASLLLIASLALPSCMMYNPRPAVVVTTPVIVQPKPYCHVPRGRAYGWHANHGYGYGYGYNHYQPQGPGYGAPNGYGPHRGPRR